jgi:hypothetical protein
MCKRPVLLKPCPVVTEIGKSQVTDVRGTGFGTAAHRSAPAERLEAPPLPPGWAYIPQAPPKIKAARTHAPGMAAACPA